MIWGESCGSRQVPSSAWVFRLRVKEEAWREEAANGPEQSHCAEDGLKAYWLLPYCLHTPPRCVCSSHTITLAGSGVLAQPWLVVPAWPASEHDLGARSASGVPAEWAQLCFYSEPYF